MAYFFGKLFLESIEETEEEHNMPNEQKHDANAHSSRDTLNGQQQQQTTFFHTPQLAQFAPDHETFEVWQEKLEIYFIEIKCTTEDVKKSILLRTIGTEPYNLLHSLCSPKTPSSKSFEDLCSTLNTHYTPPTIIFFERKKFHMADRMDSENVAQWYAKVKKLALKCKFGAHFDAFVRDKFVVQLPEKIFEKMCEDTDDVTLDAALKKALMLEAKYGTAKPTSKSDGNENAVNFVRKRGRQNQRKGKGSNNNNNKNGNQSKHVESNKVNGDQRQKGKACSHCGWSNHEANSCKYKEHTCHSCGKKGHLAPICNTKAKKTINYISDASDVSSENTNYFDFSVYSVTQGDQSDVYTLLVEINGTSLEIACDTGAPCTLIPLSWTKKLNITEKLNRCEIPYTDYGGNFISLLGECDVRMKYRGMTKKVRIVVSDSKNPPLLGRSFLRAFGFELLQVNMIDEQPKYAVVAEQIKNEFSDIFDGKLGAYKLGAISLPIDPKAEPKFFKPRPIPFAWKEKLAIKLRDLIKNGVLEPIENSDWGTPLVPILKPDNDLRVCGDYKVTINRFLTDFKYPLPRIEEIFASLNGGELFTKLDMSNAYNQLLLDEKSQLLCTWSTHIGTLKMKRLPFGVKVAAAIFQKTMENLLRGISNVVVYQDDITVTGKTFQEHIFNLKAVLSKIQHAGLKLNLKKCEFFKEKITFLGFKIDKTGMSKNQDRIKSIIDAPKPTNVSEIRAFIGMVNYHSKYIPDFARKMIPFYKLLKKNTKFEWSETCQNAFNNLKKELCSDTLLAHFDPKIPIVLATDASNRAVAGVLSHTYKDGSTKPIAYVSRALSNTETNYGTIEKEALAIIFCVTKLRQYLLGNKFTLQTDHKPLVTLFGENKGLPIMAAARIQRWAFILSGFDYSIQYIKGKLNYADHLSRFPHENAPSSKIESSYVNYIESDNNLNLNFKDIARETRRDPVLAKLSDAIQLGTVNDLQGPEFQSFRSKSLELTVEYDCVLWGYRTVVPTKLRKRILEDLHQSHLGIVKTKHLARSYVWWPKIDSDIEKVVQSCMPCQELQPSPEKSPLISWTPADSVWSRIHIDYAGPINGFYLLVVIDSYSKWVEVFKTKEMTTKFTINKLRELFCRYGIVDKLVSDNGAQFTSYEFQQFMALNHINHILTAPGKPATNGQAENFVKMVKKSLNANIKAHEKIDLEAVINRFLCDYRNAKHCSTGETPAKIFFGRSLKTRFSLLKPPLVHDKIIDSQKSSSKNFHGSRNVDFSVGDKVLIRNYQNVNKESWSLATVKKVIGPRNYICAFDSNEREIKRHIDQMRKYNGEQTNEESVETAMHDPDVDTRATIPVIETKSVDPLDKDTVVGDEPRYKLRSRTKRAQK